MNLKKLKLFIISVISLLWIWNTKDLKQITEAYSWAFVPLPIRLLIKKHQK